VGCFIGPNFVTGRGELEAAVARRLGLALIERSERCIGKDSWLGRKGIGLTGRGWREHGEAMAATPLWRIGYVLLSVALLLVSLVWLCAEFGGF
jgi:hypothetical protein